MNFLDLIDCLHIDKEEIFQREHVKEIVFIIRGGKKLIPTPSILHVC